MVKYPEDWKVVPLSDVGDVCMCKRVLKSETSTTGDIPFYKIGTFGKTPDAYISRDLYEAYRRAYSYPKTGDVLISAAGTIGRTVVFDGADAYFQDSNIVWLDNPETTVTNDYLYWCYQIVNWQTEDGGIVARLYNGNFRATKVALPPLPEQKRIAAVLGNVDKLIDNLSRRIEKKRLVKQGVMQDLLTAKKRLPGFEGEWVEKSVDELGALTGSGVDKNIVAGEKPVRLVNFVDVFRRDYLWNKELSFWVTADDRKRKQCDVKQGDVFFTPSSEMPYDIAFSAVAMDDMPGVCYSYHIYRLRFALPIDLRFRTYMFKSEEFYKQANRACDGSGTRYVITLPKFRALRVLLPPTLAEQKAIAGVLGAMDGEIAKLEAKLEKYRSLKQGLMNDLLTGRVRLVVGC